MKHDLKQANAEEWWTVVWHDGRLASTPVQKLPAWHRFEDADVVFWRSDWSAKATAVAFKCGSPEGHATTALLEKYPEWKLQEGHVHPDVNSFIVFAKGQYLTGDSGYSGAAKTVEHNTLLVDGHGQGDEGTQQVWTRIPYAQLSESRLVSVRADAKGFEFVGEGESAYEVDLGLKRYRRVLSYTSGRLTVEDSIESAQPAIFTELLHADTKIVKMGPEQFDFPAGDAVLHVALESPTDAMTRIEPNILMAPGKPGSVDKGTPEARGERLAATTAAAGTTARFKWSLTF